MTRRASPLEDLPAALAWLRDVADEPPPIRLHTQGVAPADLLGAPKMSGGFLHRLTDGPYATRPQTREVRCPAEHPRRQLGEARCVMCDDTGAWITTTDIYVRPLAAALASLRRARSRLQPHPHAIIGELVRAGCDAQAAAGRLGWPPDDRRFLSAVRALYDLFSYTAIAPARAA